MRSTRAPSLTLRGEELALTLCVGVGVAVAVAVGVAVADLSLGATTVFLYVVYVRALSPEKHTHDLHLLKWELTNVTFACVSKC